MAPKSSSGRPLPKSDARLWAEIAVTREKTPLALALAASVALALARFGGSTIQDNEQVGLERVIEQVGLERFVASLTPAQRQELKQRL